MKKTGIEVKTYIGSKTLAKIKAMVKTGNLEFDMANDAGTTALAASKEGLLEKLDKSKLDLSRHAIPSWIWDDTVAWEYYSGGIGYNTDTTKDEEAPPSWADYWDVNKYPGRRGFRTRPNETMEQALMADGIAPKDLYPLDIDRAFKSLDRIKPHVKIWISQTAKTIEHLQTKELDYTFTYSGRVMVAKSEGFPLGFNFDIPISSPPERVDLEGGPELRFRHQAVRLVPELGAGGQVVYQVHRLWAHGLGDDGQAVGGGEGQASQPGQREGLLDRCQLVGGQLGGYDQALQEVADHLRAEIITL